MDYHNSNMQDPTATTKPVDLTTGVIDLHDDFHKSTIAVSDSTPYSPATTTGSDAADTSLFDSAPVNRTEGPMETAASADTTATTNYATANTSTTTATINGATANTSTTTTTTTTSDFNAEKSADSIKTDDSTTAAVPTPSSKTDDSSTAAAPTTSTKTDDSSTAAVPTTSTKTDDSSTAAVPTTSTKTDDSSTAAVLTDGTKTDDSSTAAVPTTSTKTDDSTTAVSTTSSKTDASRTAEKSIVSESSTSTTTPSTVSNSRSAVDAVAGGVTHDASSMPASSAMPASHRLVKGNGVLQSRAASQARSAVSSRSVVSDEDYNANRMKTYPFSKPIWSDGSYREVLSVFLDDEYCYGIFFTFLSSIFLFIAFVKSVRTEPDFTSLSLFGMAVSCLFLIPATRCQGFVPTALMQSPSNPHVQQGSLAIVTGSNSGIGKATAQQMALWGCDVIIAVRNEKFGKVAKVDIERYLAVNCKGRSVGELIVMPLDLSDLESVKTFASKVLALNRDVHFLINNAGVCTQQMHRTKQGHELMFGTNYLGPFLLSKLLLDNIIKANGRILNVASAGHSFAPRLNLPHITSMDESKFNSLRMYGYSKTCIMLLTRELARRMTASNSEGISVSIQPGGVCTSLTRELGFQKVFQLYFKNLWEGSQTTLYCCAERSGQILSGSYYSKCRPGVYLKDAINLESAQELWTWSDKICADFML